MLCHLQNNVALAGPNRGRVAPDWQIESLIFQHLGQRAATKIARSPPCAAVGPLEYFFAKSVKLVPAFSLASRSLASASAFANSSLVEFSLVGIKISFR